MHLFLKKIYRKNPFPKIYRINQCEVLNNKKIAIVDDSSITPGANWANNLKEGLDSCEVLVYLVSEESLSSVPCNGELTQAREKNKLIIPIILSECNWNLDDYLKSIECIPKQEDNILP